MWPWTVAPVERHAVRSTAPRVTCVSRGLVGRRAGSPGGEMTRATNCVTAHGVDGVAFSPDGKSVAITSIGDTIQLFDIDSGTARWEHSHGTGESEISFSADGCLLCIRRTDAIKRTDAMILDAEDGHVVMHCHVPVAVFQDGAWQARSARTGDG